MARDAVPVVPEPVAPFPVQPLPSYEAHHGWCRCNRCRREPLPYEAYHTHHPVGCRGSLLASLLGAPESTAECAYLRTQRHRRPCAVCRVPPLQCQGSDRCYECQYIEIAKPEPHPGLPRGETDLCAYGALVLVGDAVTGRCWAGGATAGPLELSRDYLCGPACLAYGIYPDAWVQPPHRARALLASTARPATTAPLIAYDGCLTRVLAFTADRELPRLAYLCCQAARAVPIAQRRWWVHATPLPP